MSSIILSEQSAAPSTPSSGKIRLWGDNSPNPRARIGIDDGISRIIGPVPINGSVANQTGFATDAYLAGSAIAIPNAGGWLVGTQYELELDMVKTAAGTATPIFIVRMGTLGTTGDAAVATITFAIGTAAIDTGIFRIKVTFRTVGAGTSAVIQTVAMCNHHLAATGLTTTGASGTGIILNTSAGFNSTTQTIIGVSFNGGGSFAGTNTQQQARLFGI